MENLFGALGIDPKDWEAEQQRHKAEEEAQVKIIAEDVDAMIAYFDKLISTRDKQGDESLHYRTIISCAFFAKMLSKIAYDSQSPIAVIREVLKTMPSAVDIALADEIHNGKKEVLT